MILRLLALAALCAAAPAARAAEPPRYVGSATCTGCHTDDRRRLGALRPRPRLDRADRGQRARRLRRRELRARRRPHPLHPPGRRLRRRDRKAATARATPSRWSASPASARCSSTCSSPAPGRTQAFDIAWDTERRVWFDLYPGQPLPPGDGLHWTGPYKSWEARCAECHATGYSRNYDPATRRYAPRHGRDRRRLRGLPRPRRGARRLGRGARRLRPRRLAGPHRARADRRPRRLGRGRDRAMRRLPLPPRGLRRRQPAARHPLPRRLRAGAAARRPLPRRRPDRRRGLRVRLVPAGEDVRPRRPLQRLPRAARA